MTARAVRSGAYSGICAEVTVRRLRRLGFVYVCDNLSGRAESVWCNRDLCRLLLLVALKFLGGRGRQGRVEVQPFYLLRVPHAVRVYAVFVVGMCSALIAQTLFQLVR